MYFNQVYAKIITLLSHTHLRNKNMPESPKYNEQNTLLEGIGGTFFDVVVSEESSYLVLGKDRQPSDHQMRALYDATDAKLLAGVETDYEGDQAYALYPGVAPLSRLSEETKDAWQEEIDEFLAVASQITHLPAELLKGHLIHINFPVLGRNPIKLSPAFIDLIKGIHNLGATVVSE